MEIALPSYNPRELLAQLGQLRLLQLRHLGVIHCRMSIWRAASIHVESDRVVCRLGLGIPRFFPLGENFGRGVHGGLVAHVYGISIALA